MQIPPQVTFKGMEKDDAIEAACLREAEKLERFFDRITSCRIVVAAPHRRHQRGNLYSIRVDLTLPGGELVVNREPPEHKRDEEIRVALKEAFDRMQRQLEDYVGKLRRNVKTREAPPHGHVQRLRADLGFGFLRTADDRELYFHRNSVLNGAFDALAVGAEVSYIEEEGEDGPHATSVRPVGRHSHAP